MLYSNKQITVSNASFLKIFRLVFVLFSLYLLSDVFFRWDGFRHYATFSEFIPAVALITILWSFTAAISSLILCLTFKATDLFSSLINEKIKASHLKLLISVFILLAIASWRAKRLIFSIGFTYPIIVAVLLTVLVLSVCITWLLRNSIGRWLIVVHEKITPLVLLFGIFLVISFPIVIYHTWLIPTEKTTSQMNVKSNSNDNSLPNIILVTFDAMTTLDMSAYGYQKDTTPFIRKWAKDASLFTRAYSASTTTSTTTATLMSGKRLWTHLRFTQIHGGKLPRSNIENLASELNKSGLYTMSVATNGNASLTWMGIADSFDYNVPLGELFEPTTVAEYIEKSLYNLFGEKFRLYEWLVMEDFPLHKILSAIPLGEAERPFPTKTTISKFMKAIDSKAQEPFFAWIHFHPPHAPYTPPEPFIRTYNKSSDLIKRKDQQKLMLGGTLNKMEDLSAKRKLLKTLKARYDENMLYSDKSFENLIGKLKKKGYIENSVIILSTDHGESFDHDYYGHGGTLYESSTHIPLIIKNYTEPKGQIIDTLVGQEDIAATILGFADLPVPSWMDGRSLVPLMQGKELPPKPVFSMNIYENLSRGNPIARGTIAVWENNYKLIYYLEEKAPLLFNLKQDPDELNNLIDVKPKVGAHLQNIIDSHLKEANEKIELEKTATQ